MENNGLVYNKIVDCLNDCRQLLSASQWMTTVSRALGEVTTRMKEPMQLAIVGRISSSKSTLVNAIMGKPEVVSTGHEAVTFNVSWLKYGDDNAPIQVYFKDGSVKQVERELWTNWASHNSTESLKSNVKYIEVTSNYEMLKYINIIDTPGLDATSKVDSENTIEFLRNVRPDAVVLLFSKSLSENSLQLISDFQKTSGEMSFSINPMNALGVLSKIDMNWDIDSNLDAIRVSSGAIQRTLANRSDVNKTLFRILPVSALMGLASSYILEKDMDYFRALAEINDEDMFYGVDFFLDYETDKITIEQRKELILKYSLYGVYLCVDALKHKPTTSIAKLADILKEKSGFGTFMNLLVSHFGDRASLIKAQQGVLKLLDACNKDKQYANTLEKQDLLNRICTRILKIETELHELKEWSLLLSIYEGKTSVSEEFMQEFLLICGENGHAAVNKLNSGPNANIEDMIHFAEEKCCYWRAKYNLTRNISAKRAAPFETISKSYELLGIRLREQQHTYEKAMREISLYNHYIYGKATI